MGLFSRRKGAHEPGSAETSGKVVAAPYPRFDSGGRPIVEFSPTVRERLGLDTGVGVDMSSIYRRQAAVRLCIDFLAVNIAHCKLKVYTKTGNGDRVEVPPTHPLRQLLENPSGQVSGFEFIRDTIADLGIYGNAYWVMRRAGSRRALVRVQPIYVTGKGGSPAVGPNSYEVDVGGGPVPVAASDMTHFRLFNPEDVRVGVSILESLWSIINEEREASRHRARFWKNAARYEGWIKRPKAAGHWTREQRREFRADWREAMSGADNAGVTAILEDDMELNQGSFSPQETQFIEGRDWGLDLCATAFHIPLAVLSRKNTMTFASTKEFHTIVYVDTLGPWMAMVEKAINVQLIPQFGDPDIYVEFNIEEKLQGDFESQSEASRRAVHVPYMSVNEIRAIRNLPRINDPDFDEPAKLTTYQYATQPAPPTVIRRPAPERQDTREDRQQDQAALAELGELEALLQEEGSVNGSH